MHGDYRETLREKLAERSRINPRYSLRAFARDLGMSPAQLSQVLNRRHGLSQESARRISQRLGHSDGESKEFCALVAAADARSKAERLEADRQLKKLWKKESGAVRKLRDDSFKLISDWYHYALLELTRVRGFRGTPQWIAKRLGISVPESQVAIGRLKRLELLEERDGTLMCTETSFGVGDELPSEAIRKFNRQILDKAKAAIELQAIDEREISTLTVAIRKEDLPLLKSKINEFKRDFDRIAVDRAKDPTRRPDAVYCLAFQFFNLTQEEA